MDTTAKPLPEGQGLNETCDSPSFRQKSKGPRKGAFLRIWPSEGLVRTPRFDHPRSGWRESRSGLQSPSTSGQSTVPAQRVDTTAKPSPEGRSPNGLSEFPLRQKRKAKAHAGGPFPIWRREGLVQRWRGQVPALPYAPGRSLPGRHRRVLRERRRRGARCGAATAEPACVHPPVRVHRPLQPGRPRLREGPARRPAGHPAVQARADGSSSRR